MNLFKNKKITIALITIALIGGISIPLYNNYKSKDEAEVVASEEQTELEDNTDDTEESLDGTDANGNAIAEDIKYLIPSDDLEEHLLKSIDEQFKEMRDELEQGAKEVPQQPAQKPAQNNQSSNNTGSNGVWTPPPGFVPFGGEVTPEEQAEIDRVLGNPESGSGTVIPSDEAYEKLGGWS